MKKWTKGVLGVASIASVAIVAFVVVSLVSGKISVKGSADTTYNSGKSDTAYAETSTRGSHSESMNIVAALQTSFREISDIMLPAVVEVDVTEPKTYSDPFSEVSSPFDYFFGNPKSNNGNNSPKEYESKGLGSGIKKRKTGNTYYVLTNNHVAGSASKISVKLNDNREFEGKLVGADSRIDIALVSFESSESGIEIASLGDSDDVKTGDICLAIGAPMGYRQSVTQGIVSATGRSEAQMSNISDFIQTDAAINQGNSGGPLVNIYGEVIGINTWIASQSGGSQGLGFAIPINNIKNAIDDFIKKGKITYGWLGVSLVDVTKEYKQALNAGDKEGAFASQIFMGSPAEKGGMQPGDYIVSLNGKAVKSVNQLVRDVGSLEAGTTASFDVIRAGKKVALTVKIEERSDKISADNGKLWPGFIAVPLTDDTRKELKLDNDRIQGIAVTGVQEKSPAAALRIQNGDIITGVNGKTVKSLEEFYTELGKAKKSVNFDVYSNGGTITTGTYRY